MTSKRNTPERVAETFDKSIRINDDGCWLWIKTVGTSLFPNFRGVYGKKISVRRYAFESQFGAVPPELVFAVSCRKKDCVNPAHLRAVTQSESRLLSDRTKRMNAVSIAEKIANNYSVDSATACWNWNGALDSHGYGQITYHRDVIKAHRASYEYAKGLIPAGLVIDHLCRNTKCINPDHLEPVTLSVNNERGFSPSAQNGRRDRCIRGHVFDFFYRGSRGCKACRSAAQRRHQAKRRSA